MLKSRVHQLTKDYYLLLCLLIIAFIWFSVCNAGVRKQNLGYNYFARGIENNRVDIQESNLYLYNFYYGTDYETLPEFLEGYAIPYLADTPTRIIETLYKDNSISAVLMFIAPLLFGTALTRERWRQSIMMGASRLRIVAVAYLELMVLVYVFHTVLNLLMLLLRLGEVDGRYYNPAAVGQAIRFALIRPLVLTASCSMSMFFVFLFQGSVYSGLATLVCMGLFEAIGLMPYQMFRVVYGVEAPPFGKIVAILSVSIGLIFIWVAASWLILKYRDIRRLEGKKGG